MSEILSSPPPNGDFSVLLNWHLDNGTRPEGQPGVRGMRWTNKTFAAAIPKPVSAGTKNKQTGIDPKTVSNWRGGQPGGWDVEPIIQALFGVTRRDEPWCLQLVDAHARAHAGEALDPAPRPSSSPFAALPPDPILIGRATELARVVQHMLIGTALIIPGGPGMGKSALAIAAVHDPRVAGHFKSARHFVGLDAARDGEAMLRALGQSLGVPTQGAAREVLGLIAAQAAQAPLLAILDNAETPHESDRDGTRDWLAHLTDLPGLTLVVTVRGETPRLPAATCLPDLEQLDAVEACALFAREAQQVAADDPDLPALLAELEGHALSLILVARVADGQTRLAPVLHRYRTIRADMLAEGKGDTRLNSVRVSLRLSLESPMMTAGARRLVALLALLPDGMHEADFETLLPGAGADAALLLARLRLAKNHNARLRMLAPLREAARVECGVTTADFERLFEFVAGILLGAQSCLRAGSGQVMLALAQREAGNLDAMLLVAIAVGLGLDVLVPLSCALGFFHSATGLGSAAALESVRKVNQ